jgi:hypothetical protein
MSGNALNTAANLAQPDEFYERLIDMHSDLSPEQSAAANAALILLLANHIGEQGVLEEAMRIAKEQGVGVA